MHVTYLSARAYDRVQRLSQVGRLSDARYSLRSAYMCVPCPRYICVSSYYYIPSVLCLCHSDTSHHSSLSLSQSLCHLARTSNFSQLLVNLHNLHLVRACKSRTSTDNYLECFTVLTERSGEKYSCLSQDLSYLLSSTCVTCMVHKFCQYIFCFTFLLLCYIFVTVHFIPLCFVHTYFVTVLGVCDPRR